MSEEKTTWRLYVIKLDKNGLKAAAEARFSRVSEKCVLIYSDKPMNEKEVREENAWRFKPEEAEWLAGCNMQLLLEDAQRRQDEIRKTLAERIGVLEEELKKQLKKQEKV